MEKLSTRMYTLGINSRYSAKEMANAAEGIARTGRTLEESLTILEHTSKLATASFSSLQSATATVNKAMVSFELNAGQAADVANIFHNAVISTPLDLSQLDDALKQTASAFGSVIQETAKAGDELDKYKLEAVKAMTTMVGLQTMLGRTGSQAGTTLKMKLNVL
jgi:TP901 family phage tail tape measure protein